MAVLRLKIELECDVDAAWLGIRSPAVFRRVGWPLLGFFSLEDRGFPDVWPEGEHRVEVSAVTVFTIGTQVIDIAVLPPRRGARLVRDTGRALSGPLALVTGWEHTMAVSALPGGRSLFRDQLRFSAGPLTPLVWAAFWVFWQWRGVRLRAWSRSIAQP